MDETNIAESLPDAHLSPEICDQLAHELCDNHEIGNADWPSDADQSGLSGPITAGDLCEILRTASFLASQRRYPPRRFTLRGLTILSGTINGLSLPQEILFENCVIGNPGGSTGVLVFEDMTVQALYFSGSTSLFNCSVTLRDIVVIETLLFEDIVVLGGVGVIDSRIGHDLIIRNTHLYQASASVTGGASPQSETELQLQNLRIEGNLRLMNGEQGNVAIERCALNGRLTIDRVDLRGWLSLKEIEVAGDIEISPKIIASNQNAGSITRKNPIAGKDDLLSMLLDDIDLRGALSIRPPEGAPDQLLTFRHGLLFHRIRARFSIHCHDIAARSDTAAFVLSEVRTSESLKVERCHAMAGTICKSVTAAGDMVFETNQDIQRQVWTHAIADEAEEATAAFSEAALAPFRLVAKDCYIAGAFRLNLSDGSGSSVSALRRDRSIAALPPEASAVLAVAVCASTLGSIDINGPATAGNDNPSERWRLSIKLEDNTVRSDLIMDAGLCQLVDLSLKGTSAAGTVVVRPGHLDGSARLVLRGLRAESLDLWLPEQSQPRHVDLSDVDVIRLKDNLIDACKASHVAAHGLRFRELPNAQPSGLRRIAWLKGLGQAEPGANGGADNTTATSTLAAPGSDQLAWYHKGWSPGPRRISVPREAAPDVALWNVFAAALEQRGDLEDAEALLIEKRLLQGRFGERSRLQRSQEWFLYHSARYGYQPWRTMLWFVGLWLALGLGWFTVQQKLCAEGRCGGPQDAIVRTLEQSYFRVEGSERPPAGYPAFEPWSFTLDLMIPFIDLGVANHWAPSPGYGAAAPPGLPANLPARHATLAGAGLMLFKFITIATGVILIALMLAGLTGLIRRGER